MKYILIVGNPIDGYQYIGPFGSLQEAVEFGEGVDESNWVADLTAPLPRDIVAPDNPGVIHYKMKELYPNLFTANTCYATGLICLPGCDRVHCIGMNIPLNEWPNEDIPL